MAQRTRKALKRIFQKGKLPTEAGFSDLIDSVVNVTDDGINKSEEFGYEVSPQGGSKKLLSFFDNLDEGNDPMWQFTVKTDDRHRGIAFENKGKENALFFAEDGSVGIRTDKPDLPLTVNGIVGMRGRLGTYRDGTEGDHSPAARIAYADGAYYDIITGLDEPGAFEVTACVIGPPGRGKRAMTHAVAVCTHWASSFNNIRQTDAYTGWPWNKIKLRWRKDSGKKSLKLQIKTRSHYGIDKETGELFRIDYHISQLWDNSYIRRLSE